MYAFDDDNEELLWDGYLDYWYSPENNENGAPVQQGNLMDGENADHQRATISTAYAVFIIVNAAMGAGLLDFPHAFAQAGGMAAALLMQAVSISLILAS